MLNVTARKRGGDKGSSGGSGVEVGGGKGILVLEGSWGFQPHPLRFSKQWYGSGPMSKLSAQEVHCGGLLLLVILFIHSRSS